MPKLAHPIAAGALLLATAALALGDASFREIPTPQFRTEVIAFEDTFLYGTPREGSLTYRTSGSGQQERWTTGSDRGLLFAEGASSCVHVAQYNRAALRLSLRIAQGEPSVAICHNGMRDNAGHPNPSPGVEIVLRRTTTLIRDLTTRRTLATLPVALPRGRDTSLTVAWDYDERWLRVDLPGRSFLGRLPDTVTRKGGFGLRAPDLPATRYLVTRIQVLWQDQRDLVLYDGSDTCYDMTGHALGRIPAPTLPAGATNYAMAAIDLQRERTLIAFGGADLNSDYLDTIKGFAVRDMKTGHTRVLGKRVNGCLPIQGGGGLDGYWLLQSWTVPASTCWLDWNAYERGDLDHFIMPAMTAIRGDGTHTGFHDPANALDGSLARYLRITENWRGVNHFTVHPNLAAYAPFADVAMPPPPQPLMSHTGPAGMPTQLAVRDRDRAWYEEWAYLGDLLHCQSRGYNLFTRRDDWAGPFYSPEKGGAVYEDFVNMMPSLLTPGKLMAPLARFDPKADPGKGVALESTYWLRPGKDRFIVEGRAWEPGWPMPTQILFDRKGLR